MKTVFLLLMLLSEPNMPSIKYNGYLYFNEQDCLKAKNKYMEAYNSKDFEYKKRFVTKAVCVPFDAFPITTFQNSINSI